MIHEIRIEFVKRIMGLLIKHSKGENYLDKLENSYKNILLSALFLILSLSGLGCKYAQLYIYSNDAEYLYHRLMKEEERVNTELEKTIVFAREQFSFAQTLRKENYELTREVDNLKRENEKLKEEACNKIK